MLYFIILRQHIQKTGITALSIILLSSFVLSDKNGFTHRGDLAGLHLISGNKVSILNERLQAEFAFSLLRPHQTSMKNKNRS